jgi:cyclopropane-fatty-acyl-phospholipid synthase
MTSYLPTLIIRPIIYGNDLFRSTLGSLSWGPAVSVSKAAVNSALGKIENGTLIITDKVTGQIELYGARLGKDDCKMANGLSSKERAINRKVELVVLNESFWVRVFLFGDMGFAEAYMLGEIECSNLTAFFEVCAMRPLGASKSDKKLMCLSCSFPIVTNYQMRQL